MTSEVADREEQERRRTGPVQFAKEVRAEARKVTWATRQEVIAATILVLIMAVVASIFFFIVDLVLGSSVRFLLSL